MVNCCDFSMGNVIKKRTNKPGPQKYRHVVPNHTIDGFKVKGSDHPNYGYSKNGIKTTKYTWYNFIPKNLFEQFHRFANIFFIAIVILNFIPQVQAFAKEVAILPLSLIHI